jgi:hypothetical protein
MDYNYTLKYRTFESLLEDVKTDLRSLTLENKIEPAQLIKVAMRVNYDLGLRINMTKETILEIEKGRVRLPDDFFVMNFALLTGECSETFPVPQGTNVQDVVPTWRPWVEQSDCTDTSNPQRPVCFSKCGDSYAIIQVVKTETRTYTRFHPLRFRASKFVDSEMPHLFQSAHDEAWIKDGWLYTTLDTAKVYINYQGGLSDDEGNLLVVDHPMINEYYEYAVKKRILEDLIMDGENVSTQYQLVTAELRAARNYALTIVNTPNFSEMQKVWAMNRKAMYAKYYDMFKSYYPQPTNYRLNNAV